MIRILKGVSCIAFNDDATLLGRGLSNRVLMIEIVDSTKSEVIKKFPVAGTSQPIMKGVNYVLNHFTRTQRDNLFVGIFDTGKRVEQSAFWAPELNEADLQELSSAPSIFGDRFS